MAILKVANRYFEFDEASAFIETTTASHFDSAFTSNGMTSLFSGNDLLAFLALNTPGTDATQWFRFRVFPHAGSGNDSNSTVSWFTLFNSSGVAVADIKKTTNTAETSALRVFGSSTVTSAASVSFPINTAAMVDVRVSVTGLTTVVDVYINDVLAMTATNTNNGSRGIPNRAVWRSGHVGYVQSRRFSYSEFIVANTSTLGMRLDELQVNTAGFYSDMTGTLSNLNTEDPTTGLLTDAAGERSSWNPVAYAGSGGIVAVVASARSHRKSGVPSKLCHFLRMSGVDYDGTERTIGEHTVHQQVWETNPATGLAWVGANLSGIQVGMKSAA